MSSMTEYRSASKNEKLTTVGSVVGSIFDVVQNISRNNSGPEIPSDAVGIIVKYYQNFFCCVGNFEIDQFYLQNTADISKHHNLEPKNYISGGLLIQQ